MPFCVYISVNTISSLCLNKKDGLDEKWKIGKKITWKSICSA